MRGEPPEGEAPPNPFTLQCADGSVVALGDLLSRTDRIARPGAEQFTFEEARLGLTNCAGERRLQQNLDRGRESQRDAAGWSGGPIYGSPSHEHVSHAAARGKHGTARCASAAKLEAALALEHAKLDAQLSRSAINDEAAPITEQLRGWLRANSARVIDLFHEWDTDRSGHVSRREFREGLSELGYAAGRTHADELFDYLDRSHSGTIEMNELYRALRAGGHHQHHSRH